MVNICQQYRDKCFVFFTKVKQMWHDIYCLRHVELYFVENVGDKNDYLL